MHAFATNYLKTDGEWGGPAHPIPAPKRIGVRATSASPAAVPGASWEGKHALGK